MPEPIRVLLADDHPVYRAGLRVVLGRAPDVRVVAEAEGGLEALAIVRAQRPDVAVLDLDMPGMDGIEVARAAGDVPTRFVLLTAHRSEALVTRALDAGLDGYLLKDAAVTEILECVRQVHAGQAYVSPRLSAILVKRRSRASGLEASMPGLSGLTPTERRVLALVAQGQTSRQIASVLRVSPRTIEHHRASIGQKLNLRGSHALLAFALAHRSELS